MYFRMCEIVKLTSINVAKLIFYITPNARVLNLLKRFIFVFIYASKEAVQTVNSLAKTYLVIFCAYISFRLI